MGNFFVDQYDLYIFIESDPAKAIELLQRAVLAATGVDMEQDIKDSCTTISEHESFDYAFEEVDLLSKLLSEKIGIIQEVRA